MADNVDRIVVTHKDLTARVQTDRGTTEQYTFPWEQKYPTLEQAVAALEQIILKEVTKAR